jgi:hypothetical protein
VEETQTLTFQPLIDQVENGEGAFDDIIDRLLPEYLHTRAIVQEREVEIDQHVNAPAPCITGADRTRLSIQGRKVRPLSRSEVASFINVTLENQHPTNLLEKVTKSKLRLIRVRLFNSHLAERFNHGISGKTTK